MKNPSESRDPLRKVGLYGGTFNPIHVGHLRVAEDALRDADLDCIYFIPSSEPPHKRSIGLAPAEARLAMVQLTIGGHPRLKSSDLEIKRGGPSYSIDTVRQFRTMTAAGQEIYFLIGVDAFLEIHTWMRFIQLFEETGFIVVSRPGSGQWSAAMRKELASYVKTHIAPEYIMDSHARQLIHPTLKPIRPLSVTPVDIASSQIRKMIAQQKNFARWVVPKVERYIEEKGLYR